MALLSSFAKPAPIKNPANPALPFLQADRFAQSKGRPNSSPAVLLFIAALDILVSMIRNIAVFCASASGVNPVYRAAAEELGRALATRNIGLIYGGSNVGLMKAVAEAALSADGRVIGVIPEVLVGLEVAHHGITELHITSTMHTRKALIGEKADAFIALPGGFGTFEELFEVLAWHTLNIHGKPILLLNINGFYDKLLVFLDHCVAEGMLKPKSRELLRVAENVEGALAQLFADALI
jgi:uncharacterized protein (TIGR00730 family)